jgi:hypothetical protein
MHPHIIGHRSRIAVLGELLEHITARSDVWFATHAQIAEHVLAEAGPETPHAETARADEPHEEKQATS